MKRLLLLAAALSACSEGGFEPTPPAEWRSAEGWRARLPPGWELREHQGEPSGFSLVLPLPPSPDGRPSGPAVLISAERYRKGGAFGTPEALAKTVAPRSRPVELRLGARRELRLEKTFREPFPPLSAEPRFFDSRSLYVLLPDEGGFWALQYTATEARYQKHLAAFESLLSSFRRAD